MFETFVKLEAFSVLKDRFKRFNGFNKLGSIFREKKLKTLCWLKGLMV